MPKVKEKSTVDSDCMQLSGKLEYAMLALLALAASFESGLPLQIRQIAALQDIPQRYLNKSWQI